MNVKELITRLEEYPSHYKVTMPTEVDFGTYEAAPVSNLAVDTFRAEVYLEPEW